MSAVEPLLTHHAASDVLKSLFSPPPGTSHSEAKVTQITPASGQTAIASGQSAPASDQTAPASGQTATEPGQTATEPGQIGLVSGQTSPASGQTAPASEQITKGQLAKPGESHADFANIRTTKSVPDVDGFDVHSFSSDEQATGEDQELPEAEAKEISAEPSDNVHVDHFITQPEQSDELAHLTKTDLVHVLETFVNVLMEQKEKANSGTHANLPRAVHETRDGENAFNEVIFEKNAEIDELKTLLVEAQGTIITLLTDRVEDKAKLATLESQMRFLPDYQRLHTQPTPSKDAEELRADLTKVKDELQTIKNTAYKSGLDSSKWSGLKSWIARLTGSQS